MEIYFEPTGSLKAFQEQATAMLAKEGIHSLLALSAQGNGFTADTLDPFLKSLSQPIFGGVFPYLIYEDQYYAKGSLLIGLPQTADIEVVEQINHHPLLEDHLAQRFAHLPQQATMFLFVDGFTAGIDHLIESLYLNFGLDIQFIGAGAGAEDLLQRPCILTNQGLLQDAAVLAMMDLPTGVGVQHGCQPICGAMKITEAKGNQIISLDWQPAYEVYKKIVDGHSGGDLKKEQFYETALSYPFGLSKIGAELVVRVPIGADEKGVLQCVGNVGQGEFVQILTGTVDGLVTATGQACRQAASHFTGEARGKITFMVDCLARLQFLKEDFSYELVAAQEESGKLVGVVSLGEIANNGTDYLEFHNMTSVVGVLG